MATLLSICQGAADRIGLPRPTQVASSIDQTTRTLLGCAQREGSALARRWAWQALLTEHTFSSTAATVQVDGVPTDWDGRMVSGTFWNRSMRRPVRGPLNSGEWQALQASGVQVVTDAFRFRANKIELVPTPTEGLTYAYEYVSKNWCTDADGTGQSAWAADTDIPVLDAELLTLGVVWRFLQGRGLDFDIAAQDYNQEVIDAIARDGSRRVVDLTGAAPLSAHNVAIPEGSWAL
jgi:hypothetical protein